MNESIENKMIALKKLAASTETQMVSDASDATYSSADSLSKAIRNQSDANQFMAELHAAIESAG